MNRPSRTDEPQEGDGFNQSPNSLSGDLTTNNDLNGLANARELRREDVKLQSGSGSAPVPDQGVASGVDPDLAVGGRGTGGFGGGSKGGEGSGVGVVECVCGGGGGDGGGGTGGGGGGGHDARCPAATAEKTASGKGAGAGADTVVFSALAVGAPGRDSLDAPGGGGSPPGNGGGPRTWLVRVKDHALAFGKFVGPGFMIAVAYIDPGNYATDIAAGASYRFRLLFIVLLSNLFAIFLQSLAIKLGTVSGLNLAEACRAFLPRWLNYFLYFMAEVAIIATDIAEVIGTAIAINLLIPQIPLVAGCAISIIDVMIILFFYNPEKSMRGLRWFEVFVIMLVLGVFICFCIELSLVQNTTVAEVFQGYLPSEAIVQSQGLYQACGILGATVMPHSIYLGSGIVQPRLREFDTKNNLLPSVPASASSSMHDGNDKTYYIPSLRAIHHSMKYSIAELALSLFTFALFINSAILIVAGASLYGNPDAVDADIFAIHDLLSRNLAPAAGTVFALALLLSGVSAGIVCTIAGQMVSEGALNWRMRPWVRRLVTRLISITPSIVIAAAVGRSGLDAALNGSQVALSIVLPFITAPLIWFTCLDRYMTVQPGLARFHPHHDNGGRFVGLRSAAAAAVANGNTAGAAAAAAVELGERQEGDPPKKMANSWYICALAGLIWLIITCMNVANLVLLGIGN